MKRFQIIYGTELGVPGCYTHRYYEVDTGPNELSEVFKKFAEDIGIIYDGANIKYSGQILMAGGFGQHVYDVYKDGQKIFQMYHMKVDNNNNYIMYNA